MNPFSLEGSRGLVIGIANNQSIAWGCAQALAAQGATLAVTYLNEKAEPHVRPLAEKLDAPIILPCDVTHPGELEAVFEAVQSRWGKLDFALHAIAYARKDDLYGRYLDCSADGFAHAMSVSCHSFLRMARLAEPLMKAGGCLLTLTFSGSERYMPGYGVMGPAKAALECSVKYLAAELGAQGIRVNALSAGPIRTRAASGIPDFDALQGEMVKRTFIGRPVTIEEVGQAAAFLVSRAARATTGTIHYVDGGLHQSG
ncbi:MAG: enoyl-ACP reductase FabI [Opitutaceae bacterium]